MCPLSFGQSIYNLPYLSLIYKLHRGKGTSQVASGQKDFLTRSVFSPFCLFIFERCPVSTILTWYLDKQENQIYRKQKAKLYSCIGNNFIYLECKTNSKFKYSGRA